VHLSKFLIHQHPKERNLIAQNQLVVGRRLPLRIGSGKGVLGLVTGTVAVYFEVRSISRAQPNAMMM
jgi:hypothetical protein